MPENDEVTIERLEQDLKDAQEVLSVAQTALVEKQDCIGEGFRLAGENLEFDKPSVLSHFDASDSKGAISTLQRWNDEASLLGIKHDTASQRVRIAGQKLSALLELNNEDRTPANAPPIPGGNGSDKRKTLGQLVTESNAWKAFRSTNQAAKQVLDDDFGVRDIKTLFQTSAGWAPESTRIPGLVVEAVTRPIQILDIIPTGPTDMAAVVYMEETTRTHASAERAENAAYAESAFGLTQRSVTVRSIGTSIPVTDEQLEDVAGAQTYLESRLVFGNRQRLDSQILNGDGIAPNLEGILNKSGIQTQAKGADPVPDAIYKAMTLVRVTGRAFPNAVVFHPNDWQGVRLLRTADGLYIWGSPSEAGPERIWGVRVVQSDAETENTALVGDFADQCKLYERRGMEVAVGYVDDDFLDGRRTIRAGFRVAFVIYRAGAFCTVTGI